MGKVKLGNYIEKVSIKASDIDDYSNLVPLGVSNVDGITTTSHVKSSDLSKYLYIEENYFAYNPYRINVGSIGLTPEGVQGLVSPAYIVFKTKETLLPEILFGFLKSFDGLQQINKLARGTVRKALRYDDLCEIELTVPSIEKQNEILNLKRNSGKYTNQLDNEISKQQELLKKLRQSILQDAIEGKFTVSWREQNPDVESAALLLEKIKAEKEELVKEKKIKKQKPLLPVKEDEIPFEVPDSWEWCRLQDISNNIHYGFNASAKQDKQAVRLLRITDIQDNSVNWDTVPGCDHTDKDIQTYSLNNNDILIARTGGTIGKSYIVKNLNVVSLFASYLIRVIPSSQIDADFLKLFIESPLYWKQLYDAAWGAGQPNVNGTSLSKLFLALPPIKEQKEIVKKVEKLFSMCDELEEQISSSKTNTQTLMQAVLKEAFEK